jgi:3-hydroxyisobutyrate dehydrogenase
VRIGIVGIGNMGLAIALRLSELGHDVRVRDVDPSREALARAGRCVVAPDVASLAADCELVVVVVVDGRQSHEVVLGGVIGALRPGGCVMLCPTIAPADTEALARALEQAGLDCIDAPMSGGPARARAGTMSLMVACADSTFALWQGVLETMASPVFRVGRRPGQGARTKLVNNLLAAINLAGAAEALALADKLGLDPATTLSVIEQSSGQSWIGSDRLHRALAHAGEPLAHVALLTKDSALAIDAASEVGFAAPVGRVAMQSFADACAAGLALADDSALWRWMLEGRSHRA